MAASFLLLVDGVADVLLVNGVDFLLLAQSDDVVPAAEAGGGGGVALSRKKLRKLLREFEDERLAERKAQRAFKRLGKRPTAEFIDRTAITVETAGKTVIALAPDRNKRNDDEEAILMLLLDA